MTVNKRQGKKSCLQKALQKKQTTTEDAVFLRSERERERKTSLRVTSVLERFWREGLLLFVLVFILMCIEFRDSSDNEDNLGQIPSPLDQVSDLQDGNSMSKESADHRANSGSNADRSSQIKPNLDVPPGLQTDHREALEPRLNVHGTSTTTDSAAETFHGLFSGFSVLTLILIVDHRQLKCRDSKGGDVDWYYIYNLPKGRNGVWTGNEYYFLSDQMQNFRPSTMATTLSTKRNPLAKTLAPIYRQRGQIDFIMYSDQPPNASNNCVDCGHEKGVVAFQGRSGFWLIHSIPKFPPTHLYEWPGNAYRNGQSALCISVNIDSGTIVSQVMKLVPHVYHRRGLRNLLNQLRDQLLENQSKTRIFSSGGQTFLHFVKSPRFNNDLYTEFVANELQRKLYVQTWRDSTDESLKSDCNVIYPVCNVQFIKLPGNESFKHTKDHSKWAVTEDGNYICVGGINRKFSQFERFGGTMCANLSVVAEQYREMITEVEPCPPNQPQSCNNNEYEVIQK